MVLRVNKLLLLGIIFFVIGIISIAGFLLFFSTKSSTITEKQNDAKSQALTKANNDLVSLIKAQEPEAKAAIAKYKDECAVMLIPNMEEMKVPPTSGTDYQTIIYKGYLDKFDVVTDKGCEFAQLSITPLTKRISDYKLRLPTGFTTEQSKIVFTPLIYKHFIDKQIEIKVRYVPQQGASYKILDWKSVAFYTQ